MLDAKQLAVIELAMAEEHKKDKEALERLKRFLNKGTNGSGTLSHLLDESESASNEGVTLIEKAEQVFFADPAKRWTVPDMVRHLKAVGFKLEAQKPEATMGQVFAKLYKRGRIRIVRRGSGRNPHVYRAMVKEEVATPESQ